MKGYWKIMFFGGITIYIAIEDQFNPLQSLPKYIGNAKWQIVYMMPEQEKSPHTHNEQRGQDYFQAVNVYQLATGPTRNYPTDNSVVRFPTMEE